MKCAKCKQDFDVTVNLTLGQADGDAVEIKTSCGHCGERYYSFTNHTWAREKLASLFIAHNRANQAGGERN